MLPGLVRVNNIREFHFSRNPKIVEFLNEYDLVKEFGEGVDRIFRDMQTAGLPSPEYKQSEFMLYATLKNKTWGLENSTWESLTTGDQVSDQAGDGAVTSEQANKTSEQANSSSEQLINTAGQGRVNELIEYCSSPKSRQEMMAFLDLNNRDYFRRKILIPLIESGILKMTKPDKPNSSKQKYVKVE